MSEDTLSQLWETEKSNGIQWVEASTAAKHHIVHLSVPQIKNYLANNVSSKVEKPLQEIPSEQPRKKIRQECRKRVRMPCFLHKMSLPPNFLISTLSRKESLLRVLEYYQSSEKLPLHIQRSSSSQSPVFSAGSSITEHGHTDGI